MASPLRLSRAWALAIALLVLANVAAYFGNERGTLVPAVPRAMVEYYSALLGQEDGLWLIGNSTLAAGVASDTIPNIVQVEMGSGTLRAQVALATLALEQAATAPQQIALFVTKDDLNANGSRADVSARYLDAIDAPSIVDRVAAMIPLYASRASIRANVQSAVVSFTEQAQRRARTSGKGVAGSLRHTVPERNVSRDIRSTYMANLGRDYALDIPDLGPLAWLAQQHGTRLSIVLPPVSDAVPAWQQVYAPDVPWSSVRDALANEADAQGIRLLDYSDLLPSTTAWFRDPYHLTEAGQAAFMWSLFGKDGLPAD